MITSGCDYCNDLRHVEPAKYIGGCDKELKVFITKARENKKFISIKRNDEGVLFEIVDKCPMCRHEFTEEDYDNYR